MGLSLVPSMRREATQAYLDSTDKTRKTFQLTNPKTKSPAIRLGREGRGEDDRSFIAPRVLLSRVPFNSRRYIIERMDASDMVDSLRSYNDMENTLRPRGRLYA